MGRFKVKNIEIVAIFDKEYGKHLNDMYNKVKNRKIKSEERIVLTSISDLNKILTPARLRLIRTIKKKNPRSISVLAKLLGRDRANVYRDLKYLEGLGLIFLEEHKMETTPIFDFEKIHVEISIS